MFKNIKIDFSWARFLAIVIKEFIHIKRDKPTIYMMVGIPLMQLILFGFAINTNPRHLPTAVVAADQSNFVRTFLQALENTDYFQLIKGYQTEKQAEDLMMQNKALFIVTIPPDFSRNLVKGKRPQLLVDADATDPSAVGVAISELKTLSADVFNSDLQGLLAPIQSKPFPVDFIVHLRYNPESITQYNIVPGLLGVILTMTMVFITALAITRERERGTMENLLATPARPLEVITGKIVPYILVGYIQAVIILLATRYVFFVPISGSLFLLLVSCIPFLAANLAMGLTFSTLAENQLQAVLSAVFFFLPSILLSGFMFPYYGMPKWAQIIGDTLPLTHFMIIVRGILLKGIGMKMIWHETWPILLFTLIVVIAGLKRFRRTLD
ncbi:MAG: ABC transporter permease [Gammaproteobacteria bacterium]